MTIDPESRIPTPEPDEKNDGRSPERHGATPVADDIGNVYAESDAEGVEVGADIAPEGIYVTIFIPSTAVVVH